MFTAKEANGLYKNFKNKEPELYLNKILQNIKENANKGVIFEYCPPHIIQDVSKSLNALGFHTEITDGRFGATNNCIVVSWYEV